MGNLGFSELLITMVLLVGPMVALVGWLILTIWRLRAETRLLHARVAKLEKTQRDAGVP